MKEKIKQVSVFECSDKEFRQRIVKAIKQLQEDVNGLETITDELRNNIDSVESTVSDLEWEKVIQLNELKENETT